MSESQFEPINEFIRAGAGAGKTHNLTRKVIEVALLHRAQTGQWPRTVMTTFTRKATQELKERLLVYCLEEKKEALEFAKSTSFLTITTMHGLFNLFLSRYGQPLGLPNQFKVVDSVTADFWRKQILKEKISQLPSGHILNAFNFGQLLGNLKKYEDVYWLGDGKRIESKADYEQLFSLLNQELAENLQDLSAFSKDQVNGEKWEAFFEGLEALRDELAMRKPWNETREQVAEIFAKLSKPRKSKNNPDWQEDSKALFKEISDKIKKWYLLEEYSSEHWERSLSLFAAFDEFAKDFIEDLISKKVKEAAIEPNDLEYFSYRALKEKPELIEKFSQEIDSWFIDEFQDTSPLQLQIMEAMIGERSRYMVGDPQQSIYLFRGSRSEVFFNKKADVELEGGTFHFQRLNRRSQKSLLEFFNDFFPNISEAFSDMDAHRPALEAEPAVVVSVDQSEDKEGEILNIGQQIKTLLEKGIKAKEICFLTRTRKEIEDLQKQLMSMGFPVISHASSNFYQRREILDSMSLLKFLINPWDDKNLITFFRSPWMGLSDDEIVKAIGEQKNNYWESFRDLFRELSSEHPGQILLEARKETQEKGVAWVFRQTLLKLGLLDFSTQLDPTGRREANIWKLINIVEKKAREPGASLIQFINEGFRSTQLDDLGDASDADSPSEPNKINLMTVHSSKGLQFEYVFLPFLHRKPNETTFNEFNYWEEEKKWSFRQPLLSQNEFVGDILEYHSLSEMKKREEEESLRVLYVAMTRAREKLFLSWNKEGKKKSWAELLEKRKSFFENKEYLLWQETHEQKIVSYQWNQDEIQLRKPWDENVNRVTREDLEESNKKNQKTPENWDQLDRDQQRRRQGVLLHKIFETLKTFDRDQVVALGEYWLPAKKDLITQAIDFIISNEEIPFKDIIENGFVEWGYQWERDGNLQEKRIDLWGVCDETLWIVDYKTGSPHFKAEAFKQISEYSEALVEYLGWSGKIKWVAAYPFDQAVFVGEPS